MRALKKIARVLGWTALALLLLVVAAVVTVLVAVQTDWGQRRLLTAVLPSLQEKLRGHLSIGELDGNLLRTLVLRDVELDDASGEPAVRIRLLRLRYNPLSLLRHRVALSSVELEGGYVHARRLRDGRLNLATLTVPSPGPSEPTRWRVEVGQLTATVQARYDGPRTIQGTLHLSARGHAAADDVALQLESLRVQTERPLIATLQGHGGVAWQKGTPSAEKLTFSLTTRGAELQRLLPNVALRGPWKLRLAADGPGQALRLSLLLAPPAGRVTLDGVVDTRALTWHAKARAVGLDPAAAVKGAPAGDIRFSAHAGGQGGRGTLELERLTASLLDTQLTAHGHVDTDGNGRLQARLASSNLSRLAPTLGGRLQADATVERTPGHLRLDLEARGASLALNTTRIGQLVARLHARDDAGELHATAEQLHLGALVLDTLSLDASGQRAGHGLRLALRGAGPQRTKLALTAHGRSTWAPLAKGGGADLTLDQLEVAKKAQRWHLSQPAKLQIRQTLAVEGLRLAGGGGRLGLDGRYALTSGAIEARLRAAAIDLRQLGQLVGPTLELPQTSLWLTAAVHGTLRAPVASVNLTGESSPWPRFGLKSARYRLQATYRQSRVRAELALAEGGQSLDGQLDLPLPADWKRPLQFRGRRPLSAELHLSKLDLARLGPLLPPRWVQLAGLLDGELVLSGDSAQPRLNLTAHARQVTLAPHTQTEELKLRVDYHQERLAGRVELRLGGGQDGVVVAQLGLPLDLNRRGLWQRLQHSTPVAAVVTLQQLKVARLPYSSLGLSPPLRDGTLDGSLTLRGTLDAPLLDLDLEAQHLAHGKLDRLDVTATARYQPREATLRLESSLRGHPLLRVDGRSSVELSRLFQGESIGGAPVALDAEISDFNLGLLSDLAPKLAGRLRATLAVRGHLARPTGTLDASAAGLRLFGVDGGQTTAHATYDGQALTARLAVHQSKGGSMALVAQLPRAADRPLSAVLRANSFRLDLDDPNANPRLLAGRLDSFFELTGTRQQPKAHGFLNLSDGELGLASEVRIYKGVELALRLDNDTLRLTKLEAHLDEGSISANGEAQLAGLLPQKFELRAYARKLPIPTGTFGAWLDADVTLRGKREKEGLVGTLTVDRGTARLPKISGGAKLQKLGPLEDVTFVDSRAREAAARRKKAQRNPPSLELAAHIPGPFHLRGKELSTDLAGQLDVSLAGPVVRIDGHVESSGGWIELLDRRYTIDHARIGFGGQSEIDPTLDVRITRQLRDTMIVIEVHGTAKKPKLVLASDPPIYSESQVVAAILSGDPASQRVDSRSIDQKLTGAVSSLLIGRIKDQIAPNLPIDVIKVDTGTEGATGVGDTRLEIGKFITDTLYVSYIHQFGNTMVGTRQRRNANEANLEWRFKKRYELELAFGDAAVGRVNLYWTLRY